MVWPRAYNRRPVARTWSAAGAVIRAGLLAGALDIADALVVSGIRGVSPGRVLRHIASGVLGASAAQGGVPAALLGLLCHFTIATGAAAIFVFASTRIPFLWKRPFISGPVFGICVYYVMQWVVVPLSLVRRGTAAQPWYMLVNAFGIHMFGVGLPIALVTAYWQRSKTLEP